MLESNVSKRLYWLSFGRASTYPVRNIDFAFVGHEFQHASMRDAALFAVGDFEQHRIDDIQSCELI